MSKRMMAIALAVVLLVSALTGCGKKEAAAPVNGEELYEKMAALNLFPEMIRRDEQMVSDYYGIEPDKCVQLVNYVTADGLLAEEFLLVETKEEAYAAQMDLAGEVAQAMVDILKSTDIPIFSCFFGPNLGARGREVMKKGGIPTFSFPDQMVRTMAYMVEKPALKPTSYKPALSLDERVEAHEIMERTPEGEYLAPADCFRLLSLYGVPVAANASLSCGDDPGALDLPYPVVAKIDHPEIVHKSDVGGVRLNIANADELRALMAEWEAKFPGLRGIQVQQQISGSTEMIIGATVDPALGHSILTGLGGTLVEVLKDVSFGHVPLSDTDAERMLSSLRCARLLEGYRGSKGVDRDAFKRILYCVNALLLDHPEIAEMDINPLLFDEERNAFFAVDARIRKI